MPGAVMERPKMTKTMYQALKRHIMRERDKKKQELEQDAMIERRKKEAELRKKKEQEDSLTLGQTKEQLSQLEKKLETLKAEKHELFSQLKKVLHQEDETKKRTQMKEQSEVHIIQHHTALGLPHAQHHITGRPMLYRPPQPSPIVQQIAMKRPRSPSPPMPSNVYQQYPDSKMIATTMPMTKQQQQHPYSHPVPSQTDYKQGSYPQSQPVQVTYANQPGHTYQQPAYSKSPGKYNPNSQSAFSSYPSHYAHQQKQIQDAYPGYPVTRMQQPTGYMATQHGSNIPSLQQQLEHANQKAGFNEEKYKMQQQATPIRGVAPMQSQQHMMHQPMQIQQQPTSKGSIVTGYSARGQAPPQSSQYQPTSSQPSYSGQQGTPGRPHVAGQHQGRGYF